MDDSASLGRTLAFAVAGYPVQMARTLMQLGYEPTKPDEFGRLPNIFSYITIIKEQRGCSSLYTGIGYYLPAVLLKQSSYQLLVSFTNHKKDTTHSDASEVIAVCLRESALKIHSTIITYPLITLTVGCISATFLGAKETVDYSVRTLYKGIVPKLIVEVVMIWAGIISRRLTANLIDDDLGQAIISRVPPFIIQALLYPLNVVSTVMADNGNCGLNPSFHDWKQCYQYLKLNNQLKRGSSNFWRRDLRYIADRQNSISRYFFLKS